MRMSPASQAIVVERAPEPPPPPSLENLYVRYFTPNQNIPANQHFAGASLKQPDGIPVVNIISVYDNTGALTF